MKSDGKKNIKSSNEEEFVCKWERAYIWYMVKETNKNNKTLQNL